MKFNEFIVGSNGKISPEEKFIGALMTSSAYFHSAHFETKNFSRHKAYNEYFDQITDLTDKFGEIYLGLSLRPYTPALLSQDQLPKNTVEMLDRIISEANAIYGKQIPALQSVLDDITGLCYQVKYLLSLD